MSSWEGFSPLSLPLPVPLPRWTGPERVGSLSFTPALFEDQGKEEEKEEEEEETRNFVPVPHFRPSSFHPSPPVGTFPSLDPPTRERVRETAESNRNSLTTPLAFSEQYFPFPNRHLHPSRLGESPPPPIIMRSPPVMSPANTRSLWEMSPQLTDYNGVYYTRLGRSADPSSLLLSQEPTSMPAMSSTTGVLSPAMSVETMSPPTMDSPGMMDYRGYQETPVF